LNLRVILRLSSYATDSRDKIKADVEWWRHQRQCSRPEF
jgi:hypothetical protein